MARNDISFKVTGLDEVRKALAALPKEIAQKVLDKSVRSQVVTWQKRAKELAPVSDNVHMVGKPGKQIQVEPGNLVNSIKIKKQRTEKFSLSQSSHYAIVILGRAFYWRWVEFGSIHNIRKSFLRPTFDALGENALRGVADDVQKFIAKHFASKKK